MPTDLPSVVVETDAGALARRLADHVAARLTDVIAAKGQAVLAVSGGRTPLRFFEALAGRPLAWDQVTITLVDDRAVPHDNTRSNTILVRKHLLRGPAAAARFVPLTTPDGTPVASLDLPGTVDVAHFGMGTDGHTASWFPGGDHLPVALADEGPALVSLQAAGAPEPRTTFTWAALRHASHAVLHFEGKAKAQTFAEARRPGPVEALPVRRLLRQNNLPVAVFTDTPTPEPVP